MTVTSPRLGDGIYTFPQAARILGGRSESVTDRKLRHWITTGLTPPSYRIDGETFLSFDDLISLEIVRRLRDEGASLQSIRAVERMLREEHPDLSRPFAYEVFFTDGANVWVQVAGDDPRFIREVHQKRNQYAWKDAIATFAKDIKFEGADRHATHWKLTPWVEIDPAIQFGAPVVAGSRTLVSTVSAQLEVGTPEQVAGWYGLRVEQVEGVRNYLAIR